MSIFRRDSPASARPSTAATAAASAGTDATSTGRGRLTQVAPGTRIEGAVAGSTELLIEGEVEGTIQVEATVVVGAEGVVKGPITARIVRVAGKVIGDVRASDRVEVGAAAVLEGDIKAPRVVIAEGAFFRGKVEMQGEKSDKNGKGDKNEKSKAGRSQTAAEPKREP